MQDNNRFGWQNEHDETLINKVLELKNKGAKMDTALLGGCQVMHEQFGVELSYESVRSRYYYVIGQRKEKKSSDHFNTADDDGNELNLSDLFSEMKKIIKERDDFRAKYEEARQYKEQYEDIKKKLNKIEKESSALLGLIKARDVAANERV